MRDSFTAQHWNGQFRVRIYQEKDVTAMAQRMLGQRIPPDTWGALVGAPDEAQVHVTLVPDGIQIRVAHPWFDGPAIRVLSVDGAGDVVVRNEDLYLLADAPNGVGTRVFAHQVREARALGIRALVTEAAGRPGGRLNGYYTWMRLGFDAPIPADLRRRLPDDLGAARTLHDLVLVEGGAAWWKQNGRGFIGRFSLDPASLSLAILQAYTSATGIVL